MPKIAYQRRQARGERKPVRIKIKKDDLVRIIAGRDKGKTGKVLEVDRLARKLTIEGVMVVKRHTRPNPSKQIKGGIADKPMPIDVSNVMVLTPGGVPTRIGFKLDTVGGKVRRVRIARKGGETIDRK
ncbi:MAG: 50S ribosomal protein L24 [Acidobacteriaceae bacterium]|nr:50S ribosomal protein L24 [Acidobacteriaceae bacterium]MBV9781546.1 50S ribosomal protein L24 [Acidobacteriaceae bacterium]